MDLNVLVVVGRLTRDATTTNVGAKGTAITKFSIANNTGWGDNKKVNYFDCQWWGKGGEALQKYLFKGKQVAVSGMLETNDYTDRNGEERKGWVLTINECTLLSEAVPETSGREWHPPVGTDPKLASWPY